VRGYTRPSRSLTLTLARRVYNKIYRSDIAKYGDPAASGVKAAEATTIGRIQKTVALRSSSVDMTQKPTKRKRTTKKKTPAAPATVEEQDAPSL
jgi:hypothetical protein